jgi:hypothetical protein
MVGFALGGPSKHVNEEWHRVRWEAETETFSIREWGEIDQTKYDLESVDFSGKYNDRTYIARHPIEDDEISVTGFDVRDLPDRG